jgi:hypothetical protein
VCGETTDENLLSARAPLFNADDVFIYILCISHIPTHTHDNIDVYGCVIHTVCMPTEIELHFRYFVEGLLLYVGLLFSTHVKDTGLPTTPGGADYCFQVTKVGGQVTVHKGYDVLRQHAHTLSWNQPEGG